MEENLKIYTPANLGWLEKKLSEEEVNHLWDCVNTRQENSAKHANGGDNSNYFEDKNNWFWENTIHHLLPRLSQVFLQPLVGMCQSRVLIHIT